MQPVSPSLQSAEAAQYEKLIFTICSGTLFAQHKTNEYEKTVSRVLKSGLTLDRKGNLRPDPDTILETLAKILDIIYTLERNMEDKYFQQFEKLTHQRELLYKALEQQASRLELAFDKTKGPAELLTELADKFNSFGQRKPTEWVAYAQELEKQLQVTSQALESVKQELGASKQALEEARANVEALKAEVQEGKDAVAARDGEVASQKEQIGVLETKLSETCAQIESYIEAAAERESKLKQLEEEVGKLQESNRATIEQLNESAQRVAAQQQSIEELESKCRAQEQAAQAASQAMSALEAAKQELTDQLSEAQQQFKEATQQLEQKSIDHEKAMEYVTLYEHRTAEVQSLRQELETLAKDKERLSDQMEEAKREAEKEIAELKLKQQQSLETIMQTEEKLAEVQSQLSATAECMQSANQRLVETTTALEEKTREHAEVCAKQLEQAELSQKLHADLSACQQQLATSEQHLAESQEKVAAGEQQLTEKEHLLAEMQSQLGKSQQLLAESEHQLAAKEQQLAANQQELAASQQHLIESEERLRASQSQNVEAKKAEQSKEAALSEEMQNLRMDLAETEGALEILKGERGELSEQLAQSRQEKEKLQAEVANQQARVAALEQELREREGTAKKQEETLSALQARSQAATAQESEASRLKAQAQRYEEDIQTLRKQLSDATAGAEGLSAQVAEAKNQLAASQRDAQQLQANAQRELAAFKAQSEIATQKLNGQIATLKADVQRLSQQKQAPPSQPIPVVVNTLKPTPAPMPPPAAGIDDSLLDFGTMQSPAQQTKLGPQEDASTVSAELRQQAKQVEAEIRRLSNAGFDDFLGLTTQETPEPEPLKSPDQVQRFFAQINELKLQLEEKDKEILELRSQKPSTFSPMLSQPAPIISQAQAQDADRSKAQSEALQQELQKLRETETFKDNRIQSLQAQVEQLSFDLFDLQQRFDALNKPSEDKGKASGAQETNKFQKEIQSLQLQLQQAKDTIKLKEQQIAKTADDREKMDFTERQLKEARNRLLQISNEKQTLTGQLEEIKIELQLAKQQSQMYMKQLEAASGQPKVQSPSEGLRGIFGQQRRKGFE